MPHNYRSRVPKFATLGNNLGLPSRQSQLGRPPSPVLGFLYRF